MNNVYENCINVENEKYLIRLLKREDLNDLFLVYSDKLAVPFFNGDNCHGDNFYYETRERMSQAIDFWLYAYNIGCFVRYSLVDKEKNKVFGTIELFHRESNDAFNNSALLRLDLSSEYEKEDVIYDLISIFKERIYLDFYSDIIVTKNFMDSIERVKAFEKLGFINSNDCLIGEYGAFPSYCVLQKK